MKPIAFAFAALMAGTIAGSASFSAPAAADNHATHRAECFAPAPDSAVIEYDEREGPYQIAFVNGFAGNDWRIQAIQSAQAWAARPENAANLETFDVVSVGDDSAAQIAAIDNFIAAGYDAITFIAVNPTAFEGVIRRAERAGTILVPFDNVLDTDQVVQVNESQFALGRLKAETVINELGGEADKILMVNGLPGNATDRDRRLGMMSILEDVEGLEIVEVVGNWDTGTSQRVVADALATHGQFDGVVSQHGSAGTINAMLAADHPIVPMGVDGENGVRILMDEHDIPGISASQAPAMSAIALEAAVALLQGNALPQTIFLPIPQVPADDLEAGVNYFPDLPNSFNTGTGFAECFEPFSPEELLGQSVE
ncbi:MAG: ABC transporter substrate-binding protein [Rhizobiales bacterium]|nr:ABC transporter substrate-binding protein [Hyphomicrobiales bacterium]MBO6697916.1 ABC transporter substrate-binding protein [Hyphomicrobiales bacterium]MBO6735830.1 ABC transporter substrate-binding protein [Hyphomicrobiales bacterium]MBO6913841.1 ABC transporter substrate-binding protein [Hyphomicrobiales bacterium]MBO6955544.1 ABC transporter substrate-binding protein [Hyphomicrobiales bacterium]